MSKRAPLRLVASGGIASPKAAGRSEVAVLDSYRGKRRRTPRTAIARLITHGQTQTVRLPSQFRLPGNRVRLRRLGTGILLEPIPSDPDAWSADQDRFADTPFTGDGQDQPPAPAAWDTSV